MKITITGWEDGEVVRGELEGPCREQTQGADLLELHLANGATVAIKQNPSQLRGGGVIKVGAGAWDGALVMAAWFDAQPEASFRGLTCVELGAGVGVAGLVLAKLGANVTLTDMPKCIAYGRMNAAKNWLLAGAAPPGGVGAAAAAATASAAPAAAAAGAGAAAGAAAAAGPAPSSCSPSAPAVASSADGASSSAAASPVTLPLQPGTVDVVGLEWGADGYLDVVSRLASNGIDLVVATDCIYRDPDGTIPSSEHFIAACAGLCGGSAKTRVLVTFEARSDDLREALLCAARAKFSRVGLVPQDCLPPPYQLKHIEMYEFGL